MMESIGDFSDDELIASLIDGDANAFALIYSSYASSLMRFAQKSIPANEDCEEIVQDIFESLWKRRKELHNVTAIGPYLYSMARFKVVDYIRRSMVKSKYEEHYTLFESLYDIKDSNPIDQPDFQQWLDENLSKLPARCRDVFRLRLNENLSYKEIAHRLNISRKTVQKHMTSTISFLRAQYVQARESGGWAVFVGVAGILFSLLEFVSL